MIYKHKLLVINIFTITFFCFFSHAQQYNIDFSSEVGFAPKNLSTVMSNVLGSPYINKDFQNLKIKNISEKIYSGRYNAYLNEMEIIPSLGQNAIALDFASRDYEVVFLNDNKTYKTFNYTTERGVSKRGFLVVISSNNGVALLKEEKIKYFEKERATSSYDQDKPAKFKRDNDIYYVNLKDGNVVYLPSKVKDIEAVFPKNADKISSFIKSNKIKTKKEEDLIKLVNYIGTL